MAAVETCFKKAAGGELGDFSEQQFLDCGYGYYGANACDGASPHSYLYYADVNALELTHESTYPYLDDAPLLTCPTTEPYNTGPR